MDLFRRESVRAPMDGRGESAHHCERSCVQPTGHSNAHVARTDVRDSLHGSEMLWPGFSPREKVQALAQV